ncbi:glutamate synthase subunit beta [Candidatus Omnitrophota bacterium]
MGDLRGFLKIARQNGKERNICERIKDFKAVSRLHNEKESQEQASRCMDCATPFCHWACPIGNYIPEWNDYMFHGNWKRALVLLEATNNIPEITGRVCPALCEYACVLGLNNDAVAIRDNELAVVEFGFNKGLIKPRPIKKRTGKRIAVIGSGPAGLSCAAQLNRAGHNITVFERDDKPGGILRYGIPDFKLEKHLIDRRINIWKKEGIVFKTGIDVGPGYPAKGLLTEFDAVCLAGGSRVPRDLKIKGRELEGIYFAMDYLVQSNKRVSGVKIQNNKLVDAKNKRVIVIGGGDTGSDCVGTACRQGAKSVTQIEVLPRPPLERTKEMRWPGYPSLLKTSSSHEEGCERHWSVNTERFIGKGGKVKKLLCIQDGKKIEIEADLVILAAGFVHPEKKGLITDLGVRLDKKGNVETNKDYMTSVDKVFSAGDMRRGQSLVVWAISEGRNCAKSIDKYLMGVTLPTS